MTLLTTAIMGLLGALMMFCGGMLLYYTREDYKLDGTLKPYIGVMKKLPEWRLTLGGLLGPVAAFFYCAGFQHIALAANGEWKTLGTIVSMVCSLGIIIGGAYHAQFVYFGLIGKVQDSGQAMDVVMKNVTLLSRISILLIAVGVVGVAGMIVASITHYPRWFIVFTPGVLYFLNFIWVRLPQPSRSILFGGWYNLMFVVFFGLSLLFA